MVQLALKVRGFSDHCQELLVQFQCPPLNFTQMSRIHVFSSYKTQFHSYLISYKNPGICIQLSFLVPD